MAVSNRSPLESATDAGDVRMPEESKPGANGGRTHLRFDPLRDEHMPEDFRISLEAYRRGERTGSWTRTRSMSRRSRCAASSRTTGTSSDYIVRITHRIWEQKDIGYIYDTYSHDCRVWDDVGLQYGREKIVADTVHTNNAMPDIRLVADEVIWAGNEDVSFHTSHRTMILGTNTGYSRFGPPTGRPVRLLCIANCVSRDNEIYDEHVAYDLAGMMVQLGLDVPETARRVAAERESGPFAPNFAAAEPRRTLGQGKPARRPIPDSAEDIREFVHAAFDSIWNRRDFSAMDRLYAPSVVFEGSTGRVYRGVGQLRSHVLSMVAMFPNIAVGIEDLYWMGNPRDGFLVSIRWSGVGAHRGHGPYGDPTGRECHLWGITQWLIENNRVQKEWTVFNEFGILMQLLG